MRLRKFIVILITILATNVCICMAQSPELVNNITGPAGSTNFTGSGSWTFVVFGDSPDPASNTTTGISPNLSLIATAVAAENPDLVMYNGDLINGWMLTNVSPMMGNYSGQLENWMDAVSPIYNYTTGTGIPIYVLRGNHEDGPNETVTALLDAYLATVASDMPANGPSGEEKLTYSFIHNDAKFIATDDYIAHDGLKETVNQMWVDEQLTQDTRPFMFVFGHSPAYLLADDKEEMVFSLPTHPTQRDIFWNSLVNNNVSAYFCGHIHTYARGESQGLQEIVCGNGGAHFVDFNMTLVDPNLTIAYPLTSVPKDEQKFGYLVVTVHEDSGMFDGVEKRFNPKTGTWEIGDTFAINIR